MLGGYHQTTEAMDFNSLNMRSGTTRSFVLPVPFGGLLAARDLEYGVAVLVFVRHFVQLFL
jgi:hypothetical protein